MDENNVHSTLSSGIVQHTLSGEGQAAINLCFYVVIVSPEHSRVFFSLECVSNDSFEKKYYSENSLELSQDLDKNAVNT